IGYLGPIPLPIIYSTVLIIFVLILLNRTRFGRHVYAVGGNPDAARFSGINIGRVQIIVFTLLGFLASVSGIVLCSRMYSGQPTLGQGFEMDAIAATVLGGTSFSGGIGKIGGTIIGVLVIGVLNNGLNLLNINSFWQLIAKGIVILLAVYIDIIKKKSGK
ncbi:MAG: ABC transporter permease, partial [Acetivibrionales bacterium]